MKRLIALVLCFCTIFGQSLSAQTLVHPQKVYINPAGTGGDDTLLLDGGLKAGPGGTVTVINADGTLAIPSSSIADGSIAKIKLANDCTNGQVLIRNSAGSPPYWDCGTNGSGTGLLATDNNVTITGTGWRFQNSTVFGSSTTAQELIHVYNSGGDAGIAIQNNTQDWRIKATSDTLQFSSGTNYPLRLKNTQIGLFTSSPAATYEVDLTGDLKIGGNLYVTGVYRGNIVPGDNSGYQSDLYDIGAYNSKWRNFYAANAIFDQFTQQTVQLYDGYLIVGKSSGKLNAAITNLSTTFESTTSHTVGEFLLFRGRDSGGVFQTEYMKILNKTGAGPYTYTITEGSGGRNLDGSGANNWEIGTSYLVLGMLDDGRVEIHTTTGIPRISIISQNSTYSSFTEYVRLGGLDNAGGGGCTDSGRFGLLLGLCSGNYLRYQNRVSGGDSDDGVLYVKGTVMAGSYLVGSTAIVLDASGLDVGTTGRITGGRGTYVSATSGFWMGYDSTAYKLYIGNADESKFLQWDGTNLTWDGGTSQMDSSGNLTTTSLTATGGYIGGWLLGANTLSADSGAVGLSSTATGGNDIRFWAGDATAANAEFRVYEDGSFFASSGTIAGWTVDAAKISTTNAHLNSGGYISFGATPPTSYGNNVGAWLGYSAGAKLSLYNDANNYFQWDGTKILVKAANVTIDGSGNLTATNGVITGGTVQTGADCGTTGGGCVKLTSSGLQAYDSVNSQITSINSSGINIYSGGSLDNNHNIQFNVSGTDVANISTFGNSTSYELDINSTSSTGCASIELVGEASGSAGTFGYLKVADCASGSSFTLSGQSGIINAPNGLSITSGTVTFQDSVVIYDGLDVDSGTLYVDIANNRVGIFDNTPSYTLDVAGSFYTAFSSNLGGGTFYVDSSNIRVGVNTTSPAVPLDIDANGNSAGIRLRGLSATVEIADMFVGSEGRFVISMANSTDTDPYIDLAPKDDNYGVLIRDGTGASSQWANLFMVNTTVDYLNIVTNTDRSVIGLVVTENETVGIGDSTPNAGLQVDTSAPWTTSSWAKRIAVPGGAMAFNEGGALGSTRWGMGQSGATLYWWTTTADDTSAAATYEMYLSASELYVYNPITTTGNVTTAGLYLTNWVSSAGAQYVCTDATGSTGYIYRSTGACGASSLRYKKDVERINLGHSNILDINPILYRYKTEEADSVKSLGVTAEQLHSLGLTNLVVYDEQGRPDSVHYDRMALYLLPIIKQQQEDITGLKKELASLKKKKLDNPR